MSLMAFWTRQVRVGPKEAMWMGGGAVERYAAYPLEG